MATQVASLYAAIGADLSGLNRGLRQSQGMLGGFGKAFLGLGSIVAGAATAMGAAVVGIGVASVKAAGTFETQMNLLGVALRGTGADMQSVSDYALKMGADTIYNAQEMAVAMTGLAKAGQSWEEIAGDMTGATGTLAAVTSLAAASDLELAEAADAVAVAMATYGLEADQATGITDSLVKAADASVAEVSELVAAMQNVGPVAAQFGWSLDDVNTALALLSQRGISGSDAGTSLRSMMTNLLRDTTDVKGTLQDLNVSLYDANGEMRALPDIIGQLSTSLAGVSDEQRNLAIQTLAGTYGMRAMNTLIQDGIPGWQDMEAAIDDAASAQEVADARTKGFEGALERLSGSLDTLKIKIGTPLLGALSTLLDDHIVPLIDTLSEVDWEELAKQIAEPGKQFIEGWKEYDPQIIEKAEEGLRKLEEQAPKTREALDRLSVSLGLTPAPAEYGPGMPVPGPVLPEAGGLAWENLTWKNLGKDLAEDTEKFVADFFGAVEWALGKVEEAADASTEAITDLRSAWTEAKADVTTAIETIRNVLGLPGEALPEMEYGGGFGGGATGLGALFGGEPGVDIENKMSETQRNLEQIWMQLGEQSGMTYGDVYGQTEQFVFDVTGAFQQLYDNLVGESIIPDTLSAMNSLFGAEVKRMGEYGVNMVKAMIKGMLSQLENLRKAAEVISHAVSNVVVRDLNIGSPSKVFVDIGENIGKGLELGLARGMAAPVDMMAAVAGAGGGSTWTGNMNVYGTGNANSTADAVIRRLRDRGMLPSSPLR